MITERNIMEFWRPGDDTDEDRRLGIRNIGPALTRCHDAMLQPPMEARGKLIVPPGCPPFPEYD